MPQVSSLRERVSSTGQDRRDCLPGAGCSTRPLRFVTRGAFRLPRFAGAPGTVPRCCGSRLGGRNNWAASVRSGHRASAAAGFGKSRRSRPKLPATERKTTYTARAPPRTTPNGATRRCRLFLGLCQEQPLQSCSPCHLARASPQWGTGKPAQSGLLWTTLPLSRGH